MDGELQVGQLEQALRQQAESLVREQLQNAEASCARLRAESEARLQLRQEREILAARAEAGQIERRRLQAAEIHLAAELDRLRWALVEAVLAGVRQALRQTTQDPQRYREILLAMLHAAAARLPAGALVVAAEPVGQALLAAGWEQTLASVAPGRRARLEVSAAPGLGGIRVCLADGSACLDQTFAARQERLADEMFAVILQRLFANAPDIGTPIHG